MFGFPASAVIIDGQTIPRRRFTRWAWIYFLGFVALPILGVAAALDLILYFAFIR